MQVLSSSQKKDITPSQLLPESMFDFIYAKDGEAVIKSGDTDFILSGGQMLIPLNTKNPDRMSGFFIAQILSCHTGKLIFTS